MNVDRLMQLWRQWWRRMTGRPGTPLPDQPAAEDAPPETTEPAAAAAATPRDAPPDASKPVPSGPRRISLALQGGGSHGAFTWGVLDRLLDQTDLDIAAISGTSAGALNAAVLASGWARGGREGARAALAAFWQDVSRTGSAFAPFSMAPGNVAGGGFNFDPLRSYEWVNTFFRTFSPYEFNPLKLNPLRDVVARHVDVDALRHGDIRLFITATAVQSGQARVFSGAELGLDALLASACLPFLFQAVDIDGEPYWDGGYTGNPALYPLIYHAPQRDVVLVRINPALRPGTPRRSVEIMDRVSEITFNAGLIGELRAIAFVNRLLGERRLDTGRYRELRLHMIADDEDLAALPASSKLNVDRTFLLGLHDLGHAAATRFLERHHADLGQHSSLNIEAAFPGPVRGELKKTEKPKET